MAWCNKFIFLVLVFINTTLLSIPSRPSEGSIDAFSRTKNTMIKKEISQFYCSDDACPFFYQNPFEQEDDWKRHLAYDHFICIDCFLNLGTELSFSEHCRSITHRCYDFNGYQNYVRQYGEYKARMSLFKVQQMLDQEELCCPFEECEFYRQPLIFPVDLKSHLANKHFICSECFNKNKPKYIFETKRKLITHWMGTSNEESRHGLSFCQDCFKNGAALDSNILVTSSLPRLQIHTECHETECHETERKEKISCYQVFELTRGVIGTIGQNKNCKKKCPIFNCNFYNKPLTTPANLKSHLATEHYICGDCYYRFDLFKSFSNRRELIKHCVRNAEKHSLLYCAHCFNNNRIEDSKVFVSVIPAKLKNHMKQH